MSDHEEDDDNIHEKFIECLYGLYGPEDEEGEYLVDKFIAEAGGDLAKAEEALGEKFEQSLQEIYDVLDKVAPDRMALILAYDMLRERMSESDDKPEPN